MLVRISLFMARLFLKTAKAFRLGWALNIPFLLLGALPKSSFRLFLGKKRLEALEEGLGPLLGSILYAEIVGTNLGVIRTIVGISPKIRVLGKKESERIKEKGTYILGLDVRVLEGLISPEVVREVSQAAKANGLYGVTGAAMKALSNFPHHALLRGPAFANPKRPAIVDVPNNHTLTYGALWKRSNALANALLGLGLKKGDHVAFFSDDRSEVVELWYACSKAGFVWTAVNAKFLAKEAHYVLEHSDSKVLFVDSGKRLEIARSIAGSLGGLEHTVVFGDKAPDGLIAYEGLLKGAKDEDPGLEVDASAIESITYTSGTTGKPKGSLRSHRSAVGWESASFSVLAKNLEPVLGILPKGLKSLAYFPFYHWGGPVSVRPLLALGGTRYIVTGLKAKQILEVIQRERIQFVVAIPTIAARILEEPEVGSYDLSSVVIWGSSGAALHTPVREGLKRLMPKAVIADLYVATEAAFAGADIGSLEGKERSSGKPPYGHEVKILDESGKEVPKGEWGRIFVKGFSVHEGYYKDEEKDRQGTVVMEDGSVWFSVEDVGFLDEEGNLYVSDRAKDVINTGGELVYTIEVENILAQHPKIAEVAVIGIPDPVYQERVLAVIVLKRGASASEEEIRAWCKERMAGFKVPRRIEFVDELPLVGADKIDKKILKERYWKDEKFRV